MSTRNSLLRFNIWVRGNPIMTGRGEIDKHGDLQLWARDDAQPLLLGIISSCKVEVVDITLDLSQARPWIEPSAEVREVLALPTVKVSRLQGTNDSIGMSMHFDDADPVAVCLVQDCRQHFHGDSRNDAMMAWSEHVSKDHREDWGD